MKIPKEARKLSRSLFRNSFTDGRLDGAKVSSIVAGTLSEKPRHYLAAVRNLQRLVRLELERRHAVVESAAPLDKATSSALLKQIQAKYGSDITAEFKTEPSLIGGLRIKLGSDVWDSSLQNRLDRLQQNLNSI